MLPDHIRETLVTIGINLRSETVLIRIRRVDEHLNAFSTERTVTFRADCSSRPLFEAAPNLLITRKGPNLGRALTRVVDGPYIAADATDVQVLDG